jgi:hypothetical protein
MNVYVHELDDGLAARMRWTTFGGTRGTPNTRSHPQTDTARTATIPPRKRQPQTAATPWLTHNPRVRKPLGLLHHRASWTRLAGRTDDGCRSRFHWEPRCRVGCVHQGGGRAVAPQSLESEIDASLRDLKAPLESRLESQPGYFLNSSSGRSRYGGLGSGEPTSWNTARVHRGVKYTLVAFRAGSNGRTLG